MNFAVFIRYKRSLTPSLSRRVRFPADRSGARGEIAVTAEASLLGCDGCAALARNLAADLRRHAREAAPTKRILLACGLCGEGLLVLRCGHECRRCIDAILSLECTKQCRPSATGRPPIVPSGNPRAWPKPCWQAGPRDTRPEPTEHRFDEQALGGFSVSCGVTSQHELDHLVLGVC